MTSRKERSALTFAVFFFVVSGVVSCARSPAVDAESADYSTEVDLVTDASVSTTDTSALGDAGLVHADERARAVGSEGNDSSLAAARGIEHVESVNVALAADASTPVAPNTDGASDASADASSARADSSVTPSAAAPVAPVSQPNSSVVDSGVATKPSEPADAGVSAEKPSPTTPQVVADAGSVKTNPVVDAGNTASAARCVAGRYAGAFRGQLSQPQLGSIVLTGSVTLELTLSADGRTLDVASGVVDATDAVGTPIHADIDGTVDCTTNQVKSGTLRGHYGTPATDNNAFAGSADGTYDPTTSPAKLTGTWNVPLSGASATGTYDATKQ